MFKYTKLPLISFLTELIQKFTVWIYQYSNILLVDHILFLFSHLLARLIQIFHFNPFHIKIYLNYYPNEYFLDMDHLEKFISKMEITENECQCITVDMVKNNPIFIQMWQLFRRKSCEVNILIIKCLSDLFSLKFNSSVTPRVCQYPC